MRYLSTRSKSSDSYADFSEVLLEGAPKDGGLFVPEGWPQIDFTHSSLSYLELATEVIHPFVEPQVSRSELSKLIKKSYKSFNAKEVTPLKYLESLDIYLLELFHGPTLAFKDVALQFVGNLFEHVLKAQASQATILTATSGDTGAAAIYACLDKKNLQIVVLHPSGLVSSTQRKMMTGVNAENVRNIAIEGNFDDCQKIVKQLFQDPDLQQLNLAPMNSINWMRVVSQAVYYFYACAELPTELEKVFCVPSGNFGNIYAGWVAKQMGAPISQLIAGVNANDTLANFLNQGVLKQDETIPSLAPSMDVSIPSNLERLIFEVLDRSGEKTQSYYSGEPQKLELDDEFKKFWSACSISDEEIKSIIEKVHTECGEWIDPHTAVGVGAMLRCRQENPMLAQQAQVVLATAHPAKFGELYIDKKNPPELPKQFKNLESDIPEYYETLPNDYLLVKEFILKYA